MIGDWEGLSPICDGIANTKKVAKKSDGKIVILKAGKIEVKQVEVQQADPMDPMDPSLQWQKNETDRADYFTLQNMKSGKYLTATSAGNLMIHGKCCFYNIVVRNSS